MDKPNIKYCLDGDTHAYWLAYGEGPMRPIAAEGKTPDEAEWEYKRQYGLQYEEEQNLTHESLEKWNES